LVCKTGPKSLSKVFTSVPTYITKAFRRDEDVRVSTSKEAMWPSSIENDDNIELKIIMTIPKMSVCKPLLITNIVNSV
jgi:hypothetical protein